MNVFNLYLRKIVRLVLVLNLVSVILLAFPQDVPVQAGPQAASFEAGWLWFTDENAQKPTLVVDPDNGLHAVFSTLLVNNQGQYPAYYGYCASDCLTPGNWDYVNLGEMEMFGKGLSIALTSSGQPRVMWGYYDLSGDTEFYYAECNGSCGQPANWDVAHLWGAYAYLDSRTILGVDAQGVVHFIYDDDYNDPHNGTFYASCASGCTSLSNWTDLQIATESIHFLDFTFNSDGYPRLVYIPTQKYSYDDTHVYYAECNANCDDSNNWVGVPVMPVDGMTRDKAAFDLEVDSSGRPRLALYIDNMLSYAHCDSGCTDSASNWTVNSLNRPLEYGEYVNLKLDSQDRPHLAYRVFMGADPADGMTYTTCTANCTSNNPTWNHSLVETGNDLDASDPQPVPSGCQITAWTRVGENAAFALDSQDNPYFAYEAFDQALCNGSVNTVIKGVRFASTAGGVIPGDGHRIFLPSLFRH